MIHKQLCFVLAALLIASGCKSDTPIELSAVGGAGSMAPSLASGPNGEVVLSWLEREDGTATLNYAQLIDGDWSATTTVASGDDWFVNWADFPSVVPISDSLWAAHWLRKSTPGTYSYDVVLALSTDGGKQWSETFSPHADGTPTEHGFVSLFPVAESLGVLWLDGRETLEGNRPMTLRSAVVDKDSRIIAERLVDDRVCDCCQTDVAIAASGPVAVYRNRSNEEIRDIYLTRWLDGKWSEEAAIANDGWMISGCPVNGPAIAANGSEVAVAWFTAADNMPRVYLARSSDSGGHFGEPVLIESGNLIGRVGLLLLDNGDALLSFMRRRDGGEADVVMAHIRGDNQIVAIVEVATTVAGSLSGVPQIAIHDKTVIVAWTDRLDGRRQVMTRAIPLASAQR